MNYGPNVWFDDTNSGAPSGGGSASAGAAPSPPEGGTAAAPASTPPAEPAAPAPTEKPPASDAFDGFESDDFDLVELPVEDATGGEPGATPPQEPPKAPQPVAAEQTPLPPQQVAQPPGVPAQNVPQPPRSALEQAVDGFRTNHKELSNWASQNLFNLSKEDADGLENDAAAMIPVLMGRVYSQALQATANLIKNFVPNMIDEGVSTGTARQARASEALNAFYSANKHLNPEHHGALVDKWARAFRAANPGATRAEAIKFVGNAVSSELGLAPPAGAGNGATPPKRPAPFAPARPGTRVQQPPASHDPYEGMDMEFDQE
jgi:hypothetical protein